MEDSNGLPEVKGFLMVELGNSKDTTKTDCLDPRMEDSRVFTKFCAVRQKSRAKDDRNFHLGHDGSYMIPIHSNIGQGMRIHFEKLVDWYGRNALIPVSRKQHFNFYLNREVKSTGPTT